MKKNPILILATVIATLLPNDAFFAAANQSSHATNQQGSVQDYTSLLRSNELLGRLLAGTTPIRDMVITQETPPTSIQDIMEKICSILRGMDQTDYEKAMALYKEMMDFPASTRLSDDLIRKMTFFYQLIQTKYGAQRSAPPVNNSLPLSQHEPPYAVVQQKLMPDTRKLLIDAHLLKELLFVDMPTRNMAIENYDGLTIENVLKNICSKLEKIDQGDYKKAMALYKDMMNTAASIKLEDRLLSALNQFQGYIEGKYGSSTNGKMVTN